MTTLVEQPVFDGQGEVLKPYVPRLADRVDARHAREHYRAVDGSLVFVDISGFTA